MPPTRIIDVLAEVFRTHGFDTTAPAHPEDPSGQPHRVDLHAEKNGLDVLVAASIGDAKQLPGLLDTHAALRETLGARYALVAATHPISESVRQDADDRQVIVWDADQLASAIGRAVLCEVTGTGDLPIADLFSLAPIQSLPSMGPPVQAVAPTEPDSWVDRVAPAEATTGSAQPTPSPMMPFSDLIQADGPAEAPTAQEVAQEEAPAPAAASAPQRNVETGRGWYLETSGPASPPPAPVPSPPATLHAPGARNGIPSHAGRDPHTFTPRQGALLAPAIDKESAAEMARAQTFTVEDTRLRYHPKRLYRWSVEAFVEGQVKTHQLTGMCLVDLATKKLEVPGSWDAPRHLREGTFDVPVDHKPVRMEMEAAKDLVMAHVMEETAREATMQDDDSAGDFALTVKRRVRVQKEDVRIEDQGLHWCPVWWISGKNGEMEVDALSGETREMRLQNRPSETILL